MRVGENEMKEYNILVRLFGKLFGLMSTLVSCGRWQIIYSSDSILILIKGTLRLGNHWENLQLYLRRHWCCVRLLLPPSLHALLLAMDLVKLQNTCKKSPSPFNLSPQWKKSSLRHHFRQNSWKLGLKKLLSKAHFWFASKFSFSPV